MPVAACTLAVSWAPQYCRSARLLQPGTVRKNLCMTRSADLMQHEWVKHGSCGWGTPDAYFVDARALYETLRFPDMDALAHDESLTVGAFTSAFVAVNDGLGARSIRIVLSEDGWLEEVRICLNVKHHIAPCPGRPGGGPSAKDSRRRLGFGAPSRSLGAVKVLF